MHTYRKARGEDVWTVGYYTITATADGPDSEWHALKDFDSEDAAAAYASYLNGGEHPNNNRPWPAGAA